jgi:hypothetical protein
LAEETEENHEKLSKDGRKPAETPTEPNDYLYAHPLGRSQFNPSKTEFLLNSIYKFSPYLTGNILRLHYKDQPINAVL